MISSIKIGKSIYEILKNNEDLKSYVDDNIFPLIAENSATFPFVIFKRESISSNFVKDGVYEDEVNFSIIVVDNSYLRSLEIAEIIRNIFQKKRLLSNIFDCKMINIIEEYNENSYIQKIDFSCKITNY